MRIVSLELPPSPGKEQLDKKRELVSSNTLNNAINFFLHVILPLPELHGWLLELDDILIFQARILLQGLKW